MFHVANSMCMRVLHMWRICSCNLMHIFCYGLSRKLAILALQEKLRTASPTKAQGAWGSCLGGWFFGSEAELHGHADQCQACKTVKWNPVVGNGSEQAPEKSEYLQCIFKPALHDDRDQQSASNSENRSGKTSMIRYEIVTLLWLGLRRSPNWQSGCPKCSSLPTQDAGGRAPALVRRCPELD